VATPGRLLDLAKKMLAEPEYIEVMPGNTAAESIVQKIHLVDKSHKRDLLIHLILLERRRQVLDFVLLRPNHPSSEKKADKAILEMVNQRKISKQRGKF